MTPFDGLRVKTGLFSFERTPEERLFYIIKFVPSSGVLSNELHPCLLAIALLALRSLGVVGATAGIIKGLS